MFLQRKVIFLQIAASNEVMYISELNPFSHVMKCTTNNAEGTLLVRGRLQ